MARPVSDRTPAPLLLGGPAGTPPGGGALLGLRSLLQGTSKPKEPASCLLKEKERKAALPAATTPGPGLETAGPADAPAGAVVGGGSPRGRPGPVPAPGLLAPLLWERTLPFGDVEYVDLDAFLLEHGLPPSPPPPGGPSPEPSPARTPAPSPGPGSCGSASPRSSPGHAPARAALGTASGHRAGLTSRDTPSPVDPDTVEVLMTFEPDPADLALSSIPGHETFDPRRHRFSEEELKPQPIMKKARKIQVPEENDWSRRYKKQRAPRLQGEQISCGRLPERKEKPLLRQEVVAAVRQELSQLPRRAVPITRPQHGACEAAPTPHLAELYLRLLRLTPVPSCPVAPRARPAGCPQDVIMQINTFIILRKMRASPCPCGGARVSVCVLRTSGTAMPSPSV
uniref:D-box binding PAR bZIP transcription factor n=1 Tax=Pan troglodytes TaxID=9598 RepID=H2QGS0_PANTR